MAVSGGADAIRQALAGGYVDVLAHLDRTRRCWARGKRLFEGFTHDIDLEKLSVHSSQWATHVTYGVTRPASPGAALPLAPLAVEPVALVLEVGGRVR